MEDRDALRTWHARSALQLDAGLPSTAAVRVAEETPVAIEVNGIGHAVMLATPADLDDFALGFLLSEGLIDARADLLDVEIEVGGDDGVTLGVTVPQRCLHRLKARRRAMAGRTGCGLCGVESLAEAMRPVHGAAAPVVVEAAALARGMAAVVTAQALQQATGATHAAAWIDLAGRLVLVREDIGRHNALDKLIGAMARQGVVAAAGFVAVTSRASYEMVHKAASAGVGLLAAISAPTHLAIRTAEAAGLTLAGFARGDRVTLYSRPAGVRGLETALCEGTVPSMPRPAGPLVTCGRS